MVSLLKRFVGCEVTISVDPPVAIDMVSEADGEWMCPADMLAGRLNAANAAWAIVCVAGVCAANSEDIDEVAHSVVALGLVVAIPTRNIRSLTALPRTPVASAPEDSDAT